jgi:hypothetical protein
MVRAVTKSVLLLAVGVVALTSRSGAQTPPQSIKPMPTTPPAIQKLGEHTFRIGQINVDTMKREVVVSGSANAPSVLEFVANTIGGFKAYESALTLNTDAITFNTALVLIGLDKTRARVPTRHFDPEPPKGDPVDITVEWDAAGQRKRIRVEELLFNRRTNTPLPEGAWVYTGSMFMPDGRYLAELDGVLIGFVHSPAPIIENPRGLGVGRYGEIVMNPNIGLTEGTPVTVTIKALPIGGDAK